MIYLTVQQILEAHRQVLEISDGTDSVRDWNLLESSTYRMRATFGQQDLYANVFSKAAALLHSLIKNHPFVDGNKRTAITACSVFLELNGVTLIIDDETEGFVISLASKIMEIDQIASYLKKHSQKNS